MEKGGAYICIPSCHKYYLAYYLEYSAKSEKTQRAGRAKSLPPFFCHKYYLAYYLEYSTKSEKTQRAGRDFLRKSGAGVFRRFFRRIADKMYPWGSIFPKKEVYKKCGRSNALFG